MLITKTSQLIHVNLVSITVVFVKITIRVIYVFSRINILHMDIKTVHAY